VSISNITAALNFFHYIAGSAVHALMQMLWPLNRQHMTRRRRSMLLP
jgi:hypothetical protein